MALAWALSYATQRQSIARDIAVCLRCQFANPDRQRNGGEFSDRQAISLLAQCWKRTYGSKQFVKHHPDSAWHRAPLGPVDIQSPG